MRKRIDNIFLLIVIIFASFLSMACSGNDPSLEKKYGDKADSEISQETEHLHIHNYTESILVEATCDTEGSKLFSCRQCDDSYTQTYSKEALSASEIYEKHVCSIGEIITYTQNGEAFALGTGFVYSSDGKIITNYHVINEAYSAEITINDETYAFESILAYDKDIDIAVLKININGLKPVNICTKTHSVGKTVYAFGSSRGLTATFSKGIITYADREIDGVHYVQHDAAISSGNSGGPLINEYGEVIGINTLSVRDSQNLNFAIMISELNELDYSKEMTFKEYYEKECNALVRLKNYIIRYGDYDAEDNKYEIKNAPITSSNMYVTTSGSYDCSKDMVCLSIFGTNGSLSVLLNVEIYELNGLYEWGYIDDSYRFMSGVFNATTWSSSSQLPVSQYYNIKTTSIYSSIRSLSATMLNTLLIKIPYDYADISLTPKDLMFYNY